MSNEIKILPGTPRGLAVGAWCEEATRVVARLTRGSPLGLQAEPDAGELSLGALVTIRVAGATAGGVQLSVLEYLLEPGDDDAGARFVRAHGCPWMLYLSTVPRSPERDRFLAAVLAIAAARVVDGVIENDNHWVVPLDVASAAQWESWLASALDELPDRPAGFEALAAWYARLRL